MGDRPAPRILVVTQWAPPLIGGPQNLYNLFSQFPADSYVVLASGGNRGLPAAGSWLPGKYVFYDYRRQRMAAPERGHGDARSRSSLRARIANLIRRIPIVGRSLEEGLYMLLTVPRIVRAARRVIRSDGITMLLGISDYGPALIATYIVHKLSGLAYALYLFDVYLGNDLSPFGTYVARLMEPRLLKGARTVIVTNEATQAHLRMRYGDSFRSAIVHNSAFPEEFRPFRLPCRPEPPYTIVYTGSVYWAQEGAVLNLIRAMDHLRDLPVEAHLYAPKVTQAVRDAAAGRANVRLTWVPQSETPRIQCAATLLFLPLAWAKEASEIVATATPGKLTDYLASGRPMLVHAPPHAYVVRFTKAHDTGIVVDEDDVLALADSLRRFFGNPLAAQRQVENALRLFEEQHDARSNARRLWTIFREAAGVKGGV